jgi:hypothetical protein
MTDFNTKFKESLIKSLENKKYGKNKDKNLSQSSIKIYVRNLEKLNDDLPLKNLNYLNNVEKIMEKLKNYKENTKRGYIISICSALSIDKDTKQKKKTYESYYNILSEKNKILKEQESKNEMSDNQKKNWITWDDVAKKIDELKEKVDEFRGSKEINEHNYNTLLQYIILSLYFYKQPRRNQDYYKMNIVKTDLPSLDTSLNYLSYDTKQFIFNTFKTSKKEGIQKETIPDDLFKIINIYLKYHPIIKGKKIVKSTDVPFLVYHDGKRLEKVNSITRILNKIFGKSIGSSMLRHVYLSSKYGNVLEEQKKDAVAMGHSVAQQGDYIKNK